MFLIQPLGKPNDREWQLLMTHKHTETPRATRGTGTFKTDGTRRTSYFAPRTNVHLLTTQTHGCSALQNAIDQCNNPNNPTGSGVTEACPFLTVVNATLAGECQTPPMVDEMVNGNMTSLPGYVLFVVCGIIGVLTGKNLAVGATLYSLVLQMRYYDRQGLTV